MSVSYWTLSFLGCIQTPACQTCATLSPFLQTEILVLFTYYTYLTFVLLILKYTYYIFWDNTFYVVL